MADVALSLVARGFTFSPDLGTVSLPAGEESELEASFRFAGFSYSPAKVSGILSRLLPQLTLVLAPTLALALLTAAVLFSPREALDEPPLVGRVRAAKNIVSMIDDVAHAS